MPNILIIGATRGLGASLTNAYASRADTTVFATTRQDSAPTSGFNEKVVWVRGIDVADSGVGSRLVEELGVVMPELEGRRRGFDVVVSSSLGGLLCFGVWMDGWRGRGRKVISMKRGERELELEGGGEDGVGEILKYMLILFADHNSRIFRNRRLHKRSKLGSRS